MKFAAQISLKVFNGEISLEQKFNDESLESRHSLDSRDVLRTDGLRLDSTERIENNKLEKLSLIAWD